ncbi:hypothetical protein [Adhaeribacter terreus]|uniref:Uncharacterized protein n=1 Tax=Adhaeribacter terreus TaxID=529703 RepID=A0ABW0ED02_9BACT
MSLQTTINNSRSAISKHAFSDICIRKPTAADLSIRVSAHLTGTCGAIDTPQVASGFKNPKEQLQIPITVLRKKSSPESGEDLGRYFLTPKPYRFYANF